MRKSEFINDRINRKMPPSIHDAVEAAKADDLLIEERTNLDKLEPSPELGKIGDGKIIYRAMDVPKNSGKTLDKSTLNLVARERLGRQLTDLRVSVTQNLRAYQAATKDALALLDMAQTAIPTDALGEVAVILHEGSRLLSDMSRVESRKANILGNLATEIQQSEKLREDK